MDVERFFISSCMQDMSIMDKATEYIRHWYFTDSMYAWMWKYLVSLHKEKKAFDINHFIATARVPDDIINPSEVTMEMYDAVPSSINWDLYAEGILDNYARRRMQELSMQRDKKAIDIAIESKEFCEKMVQDLTAISKVANDDNLETVVDLTKCTDSIMDLYHNGVDAGIHPGWEVLAEHITWKQGQLTVITGIPHHGKSTWMNNVIMNNAIHHGWKTAVFSPENYPVVQHFKQLAEIFTRKPFHGPKDQIMTEDELIYAQRFIDKHIFLLNPPESELTIDHLLKTFDKLVDEKGIHCCLIDPWNEVDHSLIDNNKISETEFIGRALTKIRRFARSRNVHFFVVAHPAKMYPDYSGKSSPPDLYSIAGCYSEDTEVLTEEGWIRHQDLEHFTKVACFNPDNGLLSYDYFSTIWKYDYEGEMINFKSPSYDILVTPNHRMVVKPSWGEWHNMVNSGKGRPVKYNRDKWSIVEASEVAGNMLLPGSCEWEELEVSKDPLYSDSFLKFVGWWIAEGHVVQPSKGLGICQAVGVLSKEMKETMKDCGLVFSEKIEKPRGKGVLDMWKAYIGTTDNAMVCEMIPRECGTGAKNKKLPRFTWELNTHQKEVLLHSLIQGDGTDRRDDSFAYTTISKQLANDVQRLSIECGRMASISHQDPKNPNHHRKYQVNIGRKNRKTLAVRKGRNKTKVDYKGSVYCLTVPTGAYITRRNGKMAVCGNSAHWKNKTDNGLVVHRDGDETTVYIKKVRFKNIGKIGEVPFRFNVKTGVYKDDLEKYFR